MNRREFLASSVGILLAPSITGGQVVAGTASASGDIVLENFDNGWSGWTFTGDCWASSPTNFAKNKTLVHGYEGSFYLLSAPKGTGTATSPEVTIVRDYVRMKVLGGSSTDTRVELVVEGKVDRYVTGNGRYDFEEACVDVAHLKGKKLLLRVIDNSNDSATGTIGLDDVRQSDKPLKRYHWIPQDFGVEPQFIQDCTFFTDKIQLMEGRRLDVGLSPMQFDYAINEVFKRMVKPDMDHVAGRSVAELASLIKSRVEEVMKRLEIDDRPPLLKKWLLAEGVCAWVSSHLIYDAALISAPQKTQEIRLECDVILGQTGFPLAICPGFSHLGWALSISLALDCVNVAGEYHKYGEQKTGKMDHQWLYYNFGTGVESVADPTDACQSLSMATNANGKWRRYCVLPKSPVEVELFFSKHWLTDQEVRNPDGSRRGQVPTDKYSLMRMSKGEWLTTPTSQLLPVWEKYEGHPQPGIQDRIAESLSQLRDIKEAR